MMMKLGSIFCSFLFFFFVYFYFLRNTEFKKPKNKKRNIGYIPDDLVVNILSKVPLASLARFRSVSKGWNALIKGVIRFEKSSQIMLIDSRVYLVSIDFLGAQDNIVNIKSQFSLKEPLSNSSKEVDIREVFHCEGLLLCTTEDDRLVVWNPCLGETRWIKPRSSNNLTRSTRDIYALGKSSCNKYKILRIALYAHGRAHMTPHLYEIYDFTSNSWRVVDQTRDWFMPRLGRSGTYVDGNTYWLAFSYTNEQPWTDILLRFDFSKERFTSMYIPSSGRNFALSVTREAQKLCMLASRADHIDVWIATKIDSTGSMSWSKFLTLKRVYNDQNREFITGMNFLADEENKVIVCPGESMVSDRFLHIVGEDKYIQVDHHEAGSRCSLLPSYVLLQMQQGSLG
ncbi:putative F-box protein At4g10190 [Brassica napus]|uniref:putative F-box protein At4g10190 n=1 Tax=Brassica napus TaxID=3708 RepID=UPI0006AB4596|nr:putative F-box protein At4g10190 [Brassica napus]